MKMPKSTSLNSDWDLGGTRFLKWQKDSKGPWNTFNTIMTVCISFLQATIWSLKARQRAECLVKPGPEVKLPADVSATFSSFATAEYPACTSISIRTI